MDGVPTQTATAHQAVGNRVFEASFQAMHPEQHPFTLGDYRQFVAGKPRADGVRDFASRGIVLPEGGPEHHPARPRCTVSRRKDELLLRQLVIHGAAVHPGSVRYLRAIKDAGLSTAVVSASVHGTEVSASSHQAAGSRRSGPSGYTSFSGNRTA